MKRIGLCLLSLGLYCVWAGAVEMPKLPDLKPQRVKSFSNLARLLRAKQPQFAFYGDGTAKNGTGALRPGTGALATMGTPDAGGGVAGTGYSTTNVQVEGVDEADFVKNDGEYIYQVHRQNVLVIKAFPDNELAIKSTLTFESEFWPLEIFVDGNQLVVIGSAMRFFSIEKGLMDVHPPTVKALVYDVTDKANCTLARTVEIDGDYISSRKIGKAVYIVARKYPDYFIMPMMGAGTGVMAGVEIKQANARGARKQRFYRNRVMGLVPALRDTAKSDTPALIKPSDVYYFPGFNEPNYLLVAGFTLDDNTKPASVKAFLGAGGTVYASQDNLFVADTQFPPIFLMGWAMGVPTVLKNARNQVLEPPTETTNFYRFALSNGDVSFTGTGNVPGSVLNQFSMDERGGNFRVATTLHDWMNGTQTNNLYVLDSNMKIAGQLEGLANGERLYAARFLADRCYLVTFRQVDPLFVIDLQNPAQPTVLGQLKIPGYSTYLHPYDDNHILGFGKDADETTGLYAGMKIACFDVTDVNNPVQMHSVSIGDRGTDSELLFDHRALLFSKEKNLLAFPITVAQIKDQPLYPGFAWGEITFVGAYVYNFTLQDGFVFRKAITHRTDDQTPWWWDYSSTIRRLLYINNDLYTVSDGKIKANDLDTLEEKNALTIEQPEPYQPGTMMMIK